MARNDSDSITNLFDKLNNGFIFYNVKEFEEYNSKCLRELDVYKHYGNKVKCSKNTFNQKNQHCLYDLNPIINQSSNFNGINVESSDGRLLKEVPLIDRLLNPKFTLKKSKLFIENSNKISKDDSRNMFSSNLLPRNIAITIEDCSKPVKDRTKRLIKCRKKYFHLKLENNEKPNEKSDDIFEVQTELKKRISKFSENFQTTNKSQLVDPEKDKMFLKPPVDVFRNVDFSGRHKNIKLLKRNVNKLEQSSVDFGNEIFGKNYIFDQIFNNKNDEIVKLNALRYENNEMIKGQRSNKQKFTIRKTSSSRKERLYESCVKINPLTENLKFFSPIFPLYIYQPIFKIFETSKVNSDCKRTEKHSSFVKNKTGAMSNEKGSLNESFFKHVLIKNKIKSQNQFIVLTKHFPRNCNRKLNFKNSDEKESNDVCYLFVRYSISSDDLYDFSTTEINILKKQCSENWNIYAFFENIVKNQTIKVDVDKWPFIMFKFNSVIENFPKSLQGLSPKIVEPNYQRDLTINIKLNSTAILIINKFLINLINFGTTFELEQVICISPKLEMIFKTRKDFIFTNLNNVCKLASLNKKLHYSEICVKNQPFHQISDGNNLLPFYSYITNSKISNEELLLVKGSHSQTFFLSRIRKNRSINILLEKIKEKSNLICKRNLKRNSTQNPMKDEENLLFLKGPKSRSVFSNQTVIGRLAESYLKNKENMVKISEESSEETIWSGSNEQRKFSKPTKKQKFIEKSDQKLVLQLSVEKSSRKNNLNENERLKRCLNEEICFSSTNIEERRNFSNFLDLNFLKSIFSSRKIKQNPFNKVLFNKKSLGSNCLNLSEKSKCTFFDLFLLKQNFFYWTSMKREVIQIESKKIDYFFAHFQANIFWEEIEKVEKDKVKLEQLLRPDETLKKITLRSNFGELDLDRTKSKTPMNNSLTIVQKKNKHKLINEQFQNFLKILFFNICRDRRIVDFSEDQIRLIERFKDPGKCLNITLAFSSRQKYQSFLTKYHLLSETVKYICTSRFLYIIQNQWNEQILIFGDEFQRNIINLSREESLNSHSIRLFAYLRHLIKNTNGCTSTYGIVEEVKPFTRLHSSETWLKTYEYGSISNILSDIHDVHKAENVFQNRYIIENFSKYYNDSDMKNILKLSNFIDVHESKFAEIQKPFDKIFLSTIWNPLNKSFMFYFNSKEEDESRGLYHLISNDSFHNTELS